MNNSIQLTPMQLFTMMFLFFVSIASIFGFGMSQGVNQDSWIVSALCVGCGIILFSIYLYLYYKGNGTLPEILIYTFGGPIGKILSFFYAMYFLLLAGRHIRDELYVLGTTFLQETNPQVISLLLILLIVYSIRLGPVKVGRASVLLFFLYLLLIGTLFLVGLLTNSYKWDNLMPVMEHDVGSISSALFPKNVVFPYGEGIAFLTLIPKLQTNVKRTVFLSVLLSGILLVINTVFVIVVLGANLAQNTLYPFIFAVSQYNLTSFIERLDPIAVNIAIVSMFVKTVVLVYAAHICLGCVYDVEDTRKFGYITLPVVYLISLYISDNIIQQLGDGPRGIYFPIQLPMTIYLPVLAFLFLLFKKRKEDEEWKLQQEPKG